MSKPLPEYCQLCPHYLTCGASCHGKNFERQFSLWTRFGMNICSYIPLKLEERFHDCEKIFGESAKHLVPPDANKIGLPVLVLTYTGKGNRQTLQSIELWRADIGQVGKVFADVYLKECLTDPKQAPHPMRFNRKGNRIYKVEL